MGTWMGTWMGKWYLEVDVDGDGDGGGFQMGRASFYAGQVRVQEDGGAEWDPE